MTNNPHFGEIIRVVVIWSIISAIALVLRLVSKKLKHLPWQLDDLLLVFSYIASLGQYIMFARALYFGFGEHQSTLSGADKVDYSKVFFAASLLQPFILTTAKLSVLILLHRIFVVPTFRLVVKILAVIVIAWFIGNQITQLTICRPLSSTWTGEKAGDCGNTHLFLIIAPLPWLITDFAILIAPIPVLKSLQLPKSQQRGLILLFLMGGLTCIFTVVRYRALFYSLSDITYGSTTLFYWQFFESGSTITCASLLVSRSAIIALYPHKLISSSTSRWTSYKSAASNSQINVRENSINQPASANPYSSITNLQDGNLILPRLEKKVTNETSNPTLRNNLELQQVANFAPGLEEPSEVYRNGMWRTTVYPGNSAV